MVGGIGRRAPWEPGEPGHGIVTRHSRFDSDGRPAARCATRRRWECKVQNARMQKMKVQNKSAWPVSCDHWGTGGQSRDS